MTGLLAIAHAHRTDLGREFWKVVALGGLLTFIVLLACWRDIAAWCRNFHKDLYGRA